jgi:diguanylate cyclase (GGDEF)-like protein/PAS domain S-box-containing protein
MIKNISKISDQVTILIVDDDDNNLYTLEKLLEQLGINNFHLIKALSGEACLKIALNEEIDLIILDVQMPNMNGFEVAKFLKSNIKTKHTPIVFLTAAFKKEEFVRQGFELGAIDYFTKPIEKYSFLAKIRVYLELFKKQKNLLYLNQHLDTVINEKTAELVRTNKKLASENKEKEKREEALLQSQQELREAKQRYFDLYDLAPIAYCTLSQDGHIQEINQTASRLLGVNRKELKTLRLANLIPAYHQHTYNLFFNNLITYRTFTECEVELVRVDKTRFWAHLSATVEERNHIFELRILINDISKRKIAEEKLLHMAHYDELTGLANRTLLADRLQQYMMHVQRNKQLLALIFLDVDGFKNVNDTYGHDIGDKLLMALGQNMQSVLRTEDTIARLGGDEFVIVLSNLPMIKSAIPLITRLLEITAQPCIINEHTIYVTASLGISFYPQTEKIAPDQLLRQADQAMYQAKISGKNRYHIFNTEQDNLIRERFELMQRLYEALLAREFVLHYQPKVNMRTGVILGVEALIRWEHPQKGLVQPNDFLPLIEGHPLSIELGEWVMRSALEQLQQWQSIGIKVPISLNISAYHLLSLNFISQFENILLEFPQVNPSLIELEVLETSKLEDLSKVSKIINHFNKRGIYFSLDDFGTGYSSLTYLKQLAITYIKIDKSFVIDMMEDPNDLAILKGVIKLSDAFQKQVIAEGVETIEHGRALLQLGCEIAQGYVIARPMPSEAFPDWLITWQPESSWRTQRVITNDEAKILLVLVEHRAWIASLDAYLKGKINNFESVNINECSFGKWLDTNGEEYFSSIEVSASVHAIHARIHNRVDELLVLQRKDAKKEIAKGIAELYSLHDELFNNIKY